MTLGFGGSTFRYAGRPGTVSASPTSRVIGSPRATRVWSSKHLAEHGVQAEVVRLDGAVETAITLGVADVIADVVETGTTLRSQGLEVFGDPILRSEAVLIRREGSHEDTGIEVLRRRMTGVVTARHYVMLDYDVPAALVDEACGITPGSSRPPSRPAEPGLGRGARDGPGSRDEPGHGRAVRARSARHPRHRHRRVPPVTHSRSDAVSQAAFTPRRGRRMAMVMAVISLVLFAALAVLVAGVDEGGWVVADRLMMAVIGVGLALTLWRWAAIRAVPDSAGVTVQNLLGRRHIRWSEVVDVTFGEGDPWATLHLKDTETVAVMAIQRADGASARAEAQRLADLVAQSRTRP